jgi:hypothetical protein
MGMRSVADGTTTAYRASTRNHAPNSLINKFKMLVAHEANKVLSGLYVRAPTTPSTQATGAAGETDWNVDIAEGLVVVAGVSKYFVAQPDFDVHSSTVYPGLTGSNTSAIVAIVAINTTGTITMVAVNGTAATTGDQVAPTDEEITTAVGAANPWVKIAEITINRTGDTTCTQTEDTTKRPVLGVNVGVSLDVY